MTLSTLLSNSESHKTPSLLLGLPVLQPLCCLLSGQSLLFLPLSPRLGLFDQLQPLQVALGLLVLISLLRCLQVGQALRFGDLLDQIRLEAALLDLPCSRFLPLGLQLLLLGSGKMVELLVSLPASRCRWVTVALPWAWIHLGSEGAALHFVLQTQLMFSFLLLAELLRLVEALYEGCTCSSGRASPGIVQSLVQPSSDLLRPVEPRLLRIGHLGIQEERVACHPICGLEALVLLVEHDRGWTSLAGLPHVRSEGALLQVLVQPLQLLVMQRLLSPEAVLVELSESVLLLGCGYVPLHRQLAARPLEQAAARYLSAEATAMVSLNAALVLTKLALAALEVGQQGRWSCTRIGLGVLAFSSCSPLFLAWATSLRLFVWSGVLPRFALVSVLPGPWTWP